MYIPTLYIEQQMRWYIKVQEYVILTQRATKSNDYKRTRGLKTLLYYMLSHMHPVNSYWSRRGRNKAVP